MTKWISVEDRLPEIGQEILVYDINFSKYYHETRIQSGKYTGKENPWEVTHFCESSYYRDVTHWMPLPDPPNNDTTKINAVEFQNIKNDLWNALGQRLKMDNINPYDFILIEGFFNKPLQNELSNKIIIGGKTLPMVAIYKKTTGHLLFFSLKYILPDLKI